ncbi:hypothetical protein [Kribbella sp. CA-294648]|uniref:hypothetical protein n=1 Tax=Kribbella sp. CA-294648 TaxID=3239948 RepID=UPI003D8D1C64
MLALVDFNNVNPSVKSESEIRDTLELVGYLIRKTLPVNPKALSSDACEVECRLYDGWVDKTGRYMEKYRLVQRSVSYLAGLESGVRIIPTVVTSLACMPSAQLVGTYKNSAQKMVDQMLAQDAHHYAHGAYHDGICLIANDDDYVPVALATAVRGSMPIRWLRKRTLAENDSHLLGVNVQLLNVIEWA